MVLLKCNKPNLFLPKRSRFLIFHEMRFLFEHSLRALLTQNVPMLTCCWLNWSYKYFLTSIRSYVELRIYMKMKLPKELIKRGPSKLLYKYSIVIHETPNKEFDNSFDDKLRNFFHDIIAFIPKILRYH